MPRKQPVRALKESFSAVTFLLVLSCGHILRELYISSACDGLPAQPCCRYSCPSLLQFLLLIHFQPSATPVLSCGHCTTQLYRSQGKQSLTYRAKVSEHHQQSTNPDCDTTERLGGSISRNIRPRGSGGINVHGADGFHQQARMVLMCGNDVGYRPRVHQASDQFGRH
jgi:hypothetical protein